MNPLARDRRGNSLEDLRFVTESEVDAAVMALADFALTAPTRREQGAIFSTTLYARPALAVNEEISAFRWWLPTSPIAPDQSPIDAEIARRVR